MRPTVAHSIEIEVRVNIRWPTLSRLRTAIPKTRFLLKNPAAGRVRLHWPEHVQPDPAERPVVERILESYRRMKRDQAKAPPWTLPSAMWDQLVREQFAPIRAGMSGEIATPHHFLANFGSWRECLGFESHYMASANWGSWFSRQALANDVFLNMLNVWEWFYQRRRPIQSLSYPRIGNQGGAFLDGVFMGIGSFFNEIYGSILAELIRGEARPVVADLGGGWGKLAYFTLRNLQDSCFVDFDLPEVLCVAAYYLMLLWPEKRVLLYGEEELESGSLERYDLIFMPPSEIVKLEEETVDLFINWNSLGEMRQESVRPYVQHIARSTRFFFHMNHEATRCEFEDGAVGALGHEYPVPPDLFTRLMRYPDVGHLLVEGALNTKADIFLYLYERRASP